ncbi:MAG: ABC transporter substrate-binding protein [Chloroflexota bacterium]|nr:ABC transporter substrate-binding protein [Chloroflexota bacterium]
MLRSTRRDVLKLLGGAAGITLLSACGQAPAAATKTETKPADAQPVAPAAQPAATKPAQSKPAAQAPAAVAKTGSTVNIVYWGSFSGNLGDAEQEVVKRFNDSQKDVQVEYQFQGSYEDTAQKLTAALQARQAPDVSLLSDVWWFKFYLNKTLAPLDEYVRKYNVKLEDFQDPLINEGIRKGTLYWVPFARSTPIFYYNKQAWQEAGLPDRGPETWDEFQTWVPKLLKKDGSGNVSRYAFAHPGAASYIAWLFQGVIWQWGGAYSDPDFKIRIAETPGVQAGEFYRATTMEGWASTPANLDNEFRGGVAASIMGSTAGLAGHEANSQFPVGTAFLPKGPAGFGCCTGGSGLAVIQAPNASPEKQEAGFKFIEFATSTETTAFWSQNTGYMPVRKSAVEGPMQSFYAEKQNFLTTIKQLPLTKPQDAARVFIPNGDQIIGKGLERITIQKEPAEPVWKDVAATLEKEAQAVVRQLKAVEG